MAPKNRLYQKKPAFRDAKLFLIICEGEIREPEYFEFFDQITSRIKVRPVPSIGGKSSPKHLKENAKNAVNLFDINEYDELWFVLDVDRWEIKDLREVKKECDDSNFKNMALSKPCFEVWLYFHFERNLPKLIEPEKCAEWKSKIQEIHAGGFNSNIHPNLIKTAIDNAKNNLSETGFLPDTGSTQVFRLAEKLYELIKDEL